ncbi:LolA family protein [Desulfosudis oleivorans]|uniref:Outer membrane lipoprotein carrier protein LolA n=1 Tax=Desulfosudis oleivorans (strain DSM 6200 / JCM 39069 / Hxd3) TaxID=96561 RepID=A8ZT26_DESOH|nr:outer membrane lipoprotein carrier protein LolA [Desulfosudis oleivorans]ABW66190.1 outer membrane lipoprotein carrier protein LolA [Desulfosudis oleivorans Hxd3]
MRSSHIKVITLACLLCVTLWIGLAGAQASDMQLPVEEILSRVEARYDCDTFAADFFQTSTLKAMDITDTAEGSVLFKRPNRFRWSYEKPEKQYIISDGDRLWIFKPDENQVTVGSAPALFGDGRGASFFTDIKRLRTDYEIGLSPDTDGETYMLKLAPKKKTMDVAAIYLVVNADTFEVTAVETVNAYDDATRIEFTNRRFDLPAADTLFVFDIPVNADVIQLNSENDG